MDESPADLKARLIRRVFLLQIVLLLAILGLIVAGYLLPQFLGSFFLAFFAGSLGASLALVRRINSGEVEILRKLSRDWVTTSMPLLYGAILASVAYLLFMSGILTGDGGQGLFTSNLFPSFTKPDTPTQELLSVGKILEIRPASVQDFGKLLVWCFIAGNSEKFVVGILRTIESKQTG